MDTMKSNVSSTMQSFGMDKTLADDVGSAAID
jgi:hypothetical protein